MWMVSSCHPPLRLSSAQYHRYEIGQDSILTSAGSEINQLIEPYKSQLDEAMNEVIGRVPRSLHKEKIESTLGNWIADALAQFVNQKTGRPVDLAICNYGGVRIPELAAGPLTVGKIYELMPFDNYVVTMELDGAVLMKLLQRIADYGGWPVSSGLRMEVGKDRITQAQLDGKPVSPDQTYFVALSDYLANGGDQLSFLADLPFDNLNTYYRDALIETARNQEEIVAEIEGRITYINRR